MQRDPLRTPQGRWAIKRVVPVLSGFSFIALGFWGGACNLLGNRPSSPPAKPTIEPDSTRGDTTYYSYSLRSGVPSYLNPVTFGTFPRDSAEFVRYYGIRGVSSGRYWFMRGMCEFGTGWWPVNPDFLVVTVPAGDGKTMDDVVDDATAIIHAAGGEIKWGPYKQYGGGYLLWVRMLGVSDAQVIGADMDVLGFLSALDAHPDVLASARPAFFCLLGRPGK